MFSLTTFGPNLILDGLLVYYDFSNPNCYNGTGDTIYNLVSTKYNATIVDSPIYNSTYPQTINFDGVSYAYYNINIPESYTIIAIIKSNYDTWNSYPFGTGFNVPLITAIDVNVGPNDGFILNGYGLTSTYNTLTGEVYSSIGGGISVTNVFPEMIPYQIDTLNFYASSWSSNSQLLKVYDNILTNSSNNFALTSGSMPTSITRTSTTNMNVELGAYYNGVFRSYITMGAHLLYNRQLSDQEMQITYQILKSKFNLIY